MIPLPHATTMLSRWKLVERYLRDQGIDMSHTYSYDIYELNRRNIFLYELDDEGHTLVMIPPVEHVERRMIGRPLGLVFEDDAHETLFRLKYLC